MYFNAPWQQNVTDENFALHVMMGVNAECQVLWTGLWAHDLMLCLCNDF